MRNILGLVGLSSLLLLGACANMPGANVGTSSSVPACVVGQKVPYNKDTFHFDVTFLEHTTNVEQILTDNYSDIGKAEQPLYKSGEPRYVGPGFAVLHLNAKKDRFPGGMIPYLHKTICAGMARVEEDGPDRSKIMVPIQGVSPSGQVSFVTSRSLPQLMTVPLVPCIEAVGVETEFNPRIKDGVYKGRPNMRCNKGSGVDGVSHAMQRMRDGRPGELYVFIVRPRL